MKIQLLVFTIVLAGCSSLSAPCPNNTSKTMERVGPWVQTGPVKVRYSGMYFPALEYPDGTVKRLNFCASYPLMGISDGITIDLKYREVNPYTSFNDPCNEFENYRVIRSGSK